MSTPNVARMVADRVTITNTVAAAIRIHGAEVAAVVEKALFLAGAPNNLRIADVLIALGTHLERTTNALVDADRAHSSELADDEGHRSEMNAQG